MGRFIIIGERIHCISPVIREAMNTMNPEPILARAKEQLDAGATYIDVNIGPAESNGPELMSWAVKLLQENFDNVPLALDTANKAAIEAGIAVYNRDKGKPIVNSADAGDRLSYVDLAAANDAIVIALCSKGAVPGSLDEIMGFCQELLEHGMMLGMEPTDMWFDPLFLVAKGCNQRIRGDGPEFYGRSVQRFQRYAQGTETDHGFRYAGYVYGKRPDLRYRKSLRQKTDRDNEILRYLERQLYVRRFLSGSVKNTLSQQIERTWCLSCFTGQALSI